MYHQKGGGNVSFILRKIKKQNAYSCKFQKNEKCRCVIVTNAYIKNICDIVEINKNPQNPLKDF